MVEVDFGSGWCSATCSVFVDWMAGSSEGKSTGCGAYD